MPDEKVNWKVRCINCQWQGWSKDCPVKSDSGNYIVCPSCGDERLATLFDTEG